MKLQVLKSNAAKAVIGTGLAAVAGSSFAAVDAAAAITEITAGGTTISSIGMAVLGIVVTLAVFRYIKRAF